MASDLTTVEKLTGIYLRFIKVTDEKRLTDILTKILPNLLMVYFEGDCLSNEEKLKQLEEILTYLQSRIVNSKGGVKPPIATLFEILVSPEYTHCMSQNIRMRVKSRIFGFVEKNLVLDYVTPEDTNIFKVVLRALRSQTLPIEDKIYLHVILIVRSKFGYLDKKSPEALKELTEKFKQIFEENKSEEQKEENKQDVSAGQKAKQVFVQFAFLFTVATFPLWDNLLLSPYQQRIQLFQPQDGTLTTSLQFQQSLENACFQVISNQELFEVKDVLPVLLIASTETASHAVSDAAQSILKQTSLDTEDQETATFIYEVIFGNFDMFFNGTERNLIGSAPITVQKNLTNYLMKYPSAMTQQPQNMKLIDQFLFDQQYSYYMQKHGLDFIRQILKSDENLDKNVLQRLKQDLEKVKLDTQLGFSEESIAMAILLLAQVADRDFDMVFVRGTGQNRETDLSLIMDVFHKLKQRIAQAELDGVNVREDDICLTLMEALNKFRDSLEQRSTKQESQTGSDKQVAVSVSESMLQDYLEKYLTKEGLGQNGELIYILFLYLARINPQKPSSTLLLNTVILQTHQDIKIRKEAQNQLERIQKMPDSQLQNTLRGFLNSAKNFLSAFSMTTMEVQEADEVKASLQQQIRSVSSAPQITLDFVEKVFAISKMALRFYKVEKDKNQRDACQRDLEKLLISNFQSTFFKFKSDFTKELQQLKAFLKMQPKNIQFINSQAVLMQLCHITNGQNCFNIIQRTTGVALINKILNICSEKQRQDQLQVLFSEVYSSNKEEQDLPKGLEPRLQLVFKHTLVSLGSLKNSDAQNRSLQIIFKLLLMTLEEPLSPNSIELLRMLSFCTGLIAKSINLEQTLNQLLLDQTIKSDMEESKDGEQNSSTDSTSKFDQTIQKVETLICKRSADLNFRQYLCSQIYKILRQNETRSKKTAQNLYESLADYEHADFQKQLGKSLCHLWLQGNELTSKIEHTIKQLLSKESTWTLNVKRHNVIYLHQMIETMSVKDAEFVKVRLLDFQKIFLKYLFDKKEATQELASHGLTLVFGLGDESQKKELVDSLSRTFSGQTAPQEPASDREIKEQFEEMKNEELPVEIIQSSEQKMKLKTYQDLSNVADLLNNRALIYQFLEIQRSMEKHDKMQKAAKGLAHILMLDDRMKDDLIKLAPKILLLTYDQNKDVSFTMRELWHVLIDADQESKVIEERWTEIYTEAFKQFVGDNLRQKLAASRALTDHLPNRSWGQIKSNFRVIFLTALGSLENGSDSLKASCYNLAKSLKRMTLAVGNVYTNRDEEELREVLSMVVPMVLDDCIKSQIQPVRYFGLDILSEIVKSSKSQNVAEKLKIKNKYEAQMAFNYNSQVKIRQILNSYMDRIILEMIQNSSGMIKAVQQINMLESLAAEMGLLDKGKEKVAKQYGVSEPEINAMRVKYSQDSAHGEILKICREMMTVETFDKVLPDILKSLRAGHDLLTKSLAATFISDTILEGRADLISPKNARLISRKLVEIYQQSTVVDCLSMKESLQQLYASCLGQQMKILKEFPNTVTQIVQSVAELPEELEVVKILQVTEILKGLPEKLIADNDGQLFETFLPGIFVNRFSSENPRLRSLSKKAWEQLTQNVENLAKLNSEKILDKIAFEMDQSLYDRRVAAAQALRELSSKVSESAMQGESFDKVTAALVRLIKGKFFNGKEQIIQTYAYLTKQEFLTSTELHTQFLTISIEQAQKASGMYNEYKNALMIALGEVLDQVHAGQIQAEALSAIFDFLILQLSDSLQKIVSQGETGMLAESKGIFFNVDEKRDEDKQTLITVEQVYAVMPRLLKQADTSDTAAAQSMLDILFEMSQEKYARTNWMVRQAMLVCYRQLLVSQQFKESQLKGKTANFGAILIEKAVEYGEKYDQNLVYLSDICLGSAEILSKTPQEAEVQLFAKNAQKLVQMLQDKKTEILAQNIDLIRRYTSQIIAQS